MTNRIMLRADANENTISIRTVSARMKSPQAGICGGLILHGQEDMSKAYYGIHT